MNDNNVSIESWLHGVDGDFYITAGFAKDVADVIYWARKLVTVENKELAATYLKDALARLDKRASDAE